MKIKTSRQRMASSITCLIFLFSQISISVTPATASEVVFNSKTNSYAPVIPFNLVKTNTTSDVSVSYPDSLADTSPLSVSTNTSSDTATSSSTETGTSTDTETNTSIETATTSLTVTETSSETSSDSFAVQNHALFQAEPAAPVDLGFVPAAPPPLPDGWTRVASNPNFAFIEEPPIIMELYTQINYRVRNLVTGEEYPPIIKSITYTVATDLESRESLAVPDVSNDGHYLIYVYDGWCTRSSSGCAHKNILEIYDLPARVRGTTLLRKSTVDDFMNATFEIKNGISAVKVVYRSGDTEYFDLATGNQILLPAPAGWSIFGNNATQISGLDEGLARISARGAALDNYVIWSLDPQPVVNPMRWVQIEINATFIDPNQAGHLSIFAYNYDLPNSWLRSLTTDFVIHQGRQIINIPLRDNTQTLTNLEFSMPLTSNLRTIDFLNVRFLDELPVPAGWTRAQSNPNFAFRVSSNRPVGYTLELQDLRTTQVWQLISTGVSVNVPNVFDVTPDGNTVIYEGDAIPVMNPILNIPYRTAGVYIQRIYPAPEERQEFLQEGNLLSVDFSDPSAITYVAEQVYPSGTILHTTTQVRLSDLEVTGSVSRLLAAGSGFYIDPDTRIAVQPEYYRELTYYSGYIYKVFGEGNETYLSQVGRTLDIGFDLFEWPDDLFRPIPPPGTFTLIDAYTTSSGHAVVSVSLDSERFNRTVIVDTLSGKRLIFDGAATAVTYAGDIVTYRVIQQDGAIEEVIVDLKLMQIVPPLPAGWTRAQSNPNFAFQINFPFPNVKALNLLNLITGQTSMLDSIGLIGAGVNQNFQALYDVSPDGAVVVWGAVKFSGAFGASPLGPIYTVREIANPSESITLPGAIESINFNADNTVTIIASGITTTLPLNIASIPKVVAPDGTLLCRLPACSYSGVYVYVADNIVIWTQGGAVPGIVHVFDSSAGLNHLTEIMTYNYISQLSGPGAGVTPSLAAFVNIYKIGNKKYITTAFEFPGIAGFPGTPRRTYVVDVTSQRVLVLEGKATSVRYAGRFAIYNLQLVNGSSRQAMIDLVNLKEVTPPNPVMSIKPVIVVGAVVAMQIDMAFTAVGEYVLESSSDSNHWQKITDYTVLQIGTELTYQDTNVSGSMKLYRLRNVTTVVESPDHAHKVMKVGDYLIVADSQGAEINRIQVEAEQSRLVNFNVTNSGIYVVQDQRGNTVLSYASFDNLQPMQVTLPSGAQFGSSSTVVFVGPGIADIMGLDRNVRRINLQTGEFLLAPGWTRANSNPNFAFRINTSTSFPVYKTLQVENLKTGEIQDLKYATNQTISPIYDVSPDGSSVVYSYREIDLSIGIDRDYIIVQHLSNPDEKFVINDQGPLEALSFTSHQEVVLDTFTFHAVPVDLATLQIIWDRTAPEIVNSPNGRYQIKDERPTGRLLVADLTTHQLRELRFSITEAPIISINVTNDGIYYVAGHDKYPVIRYVKFSDAFGQTNFVIPEKIKKTIKLSIIPRDRNAIQFVTGKAMAYIKDIKGMTYSVDLAATPPIIKLVLIRNPIVIRK